MAKWKYNLSSFLILLCYLSIISDGGSQVKAFQYSDLQALNVSCNNKDSCTRDSRHSKFILSLNWKDRNCFCDDRCGLYDDCCLDAEPFVLYEDPRLYENRTIGCVELKNYGSIYMLQQCSAAWLLNKTSEELSAAEGVEAQCLAASNHSHDPFVGLPVTSRITKFTYANYYCAVCNEDAGDIISWLPRLECSDLLKKDVDLNQTSVMEKLSFANGSWVLEADSQQTCSVDPFMPDTVVEEVRLCRRTIDDCPASTSDELRALCSTYTAVIYDGRIAYKNYHCATCNGVPLQHLSCQSNLDVLRFNLHKDQFNQGAFSILFDFSDQSGTLSVGFKCEDFEAWDPFFKKCRNVMCPDRNARFTRGKCASPSRPKTSSTYSGPEYDIAQEVSNSSADIQQKILVFPDEIVSNVTHTPGVVSQHLNCNRVLLPKSEFDLMENGKVYISKYGKVLDEDEYEKHDEGILVCLLSAGSGKFSTTMTYITFVGLGISFVCLVLHLLSFIFVKEFRNLSGKNLASLCVALLGAHSCFVLGIFGEAGKAECVVLAVLMYFFYLSSFLWMNVMAFDVWRTLRLATNELRVSLGKQCLKFTLYSLYAWLLPVAAATVAIGVDIWEPNTIAPPFRPHFGERLCWFTERKALLVFFAAPLSVIMVLNISFFIMSAKMIATTAFASSKFSACDPATQQNFRLYLRLALLMGLSWISGITAGYFQEGVLWYIFIVLNTLQGAFIFAAFTCKKTVLNAFIHRCCCCRSVLRHRTLGISSSRSSRPESYGGRRNLESQDSNHSQVSQSSLARLTPTFASEQSLSDTVVHL